jgi:hypothetical protein
LFDFPAFTAALMAVASVPRAPPVDTRQPASSALFVALVVSILIPTDSLREPTTAITLSCPVLAEESAIIFTLKCPEGSGLSI